MRRAILFDRDGTLNEDVGYLVDLERLRILDGAADAVARARACGFLTVLITNQSAVARGLIDEAAVVEANRRVAAACGPFDGIYWCPHHPEVGQPPLRCDCSCRKPAPGMLLQAQAALHLDLASSFVIGDSHVDLGAAARAGCRAILVRTGKGMQTEAKLAIHGARPAHVADDVRAAVEWAISASEQLAGEELDGR